MNQRYFYIARENAIKNPLKFKMCAVFIPSYGKEIYVACNTIYKTHPQSKTIYGNLHAELNVLLRVGLRNTKKIENGEIYVYRWAIYGQAMAKLCKSCEALLRKFKVAKVYFSDKDGFYEMDLRR